ncbi:hypothetical protein KDA_55340 [Dictyobacter alpinus]|uniref:DUF2690 domain-containing protein n=1 Tax=Dictyobacter alpinus TaxID=2014873 RepID=A0A402BFJ6_9CHLR|nr:hypothetical protein [Dictyobacter alpinus]GCE30050.1 hypothetical protein KDA_55340 [Dictyobacter alpinus]
MRYRFPILLVIMVVVLGSFLFIAPSSALAATTCSGTSCDHLAPQNAQNAHQQICSSNASEAIAPFYGDGWTLDLRWGPNCSTNWARFGSAGGALECFDLQVIRVYSSKYSGLPATVDNAYGCGPQDGIWTNQLYAPGPAQACIRFSKWWDQSNYGQWYCTGVTP